MIKNITETSWENKFKMESKRLKEKFERLRDIDERTQRVPRESKLKHEVIDLTKDGIDDDIKAFLTLGPDFSEAPRKIPYEKIIKETENMCQIIENEKETSPNKAPELEREKHKLREKVKHLLKKQEKKKIKPHSTRRSRKNKSVQR